MARKTLLVSPTKERKLITKVSSDILEKYPDLTPENTLVIMVSPDYSATAAMHVAHNLSKDGEMCDILPIHVSYPDETINKYVDKATMDLHFHFQFTDKFYTNYVLVEAGVIRGGTYTWLTNLLKKKLVGKIITTTLYENIGSRFKSDVVGEYYDDSKQDLTFYFERENKHWN